MDDMGTGCQRWIFGDCEIDLDARELRRDGEIIDLEPRAFDLLAFLLAHVGEVVSRDEMLESVWSGRVVSDSAFNQAVRKVRRAVGDDGNAQRIVRTVSRRGYRFVADVRKGVGDDEPLRREPAHDVTKQPAFISRRWLAVGVVALVLGLVLLVGEDQVAADAQSRYAVLPIAVSADHTEQWIELGLMALIDETLARHAVDTVDPTAILNVLEQTDTQTADDARRVAAITDSYGPVRVIAASATRDDLGWRLDYSVFGDGNERRANQIHADTPAELAALLTGELLAPRHLASAPESSLAEELHARGLAANLKGDFRAAAEYFMVALREAPERPWTRYELALAQRELGRSDIARATLTELIDIARRNGDFKLQTNAHSALGILEWRGARFEAAEAHLREGLALAEAHDGKTAGLTLNLGILARSRNELEQATDLYRRALARYRIDGDRAGEAKVYNSLGVLAWNEGRYAESGRMHQRALDLRRELGLRGEVATSVNNLGTLAVLEGRWNQAEKLYTQAIDLHRELGNHGHFARSKSNLASLRLWQGRYTEADALATEAVAVAGDADYRPALREACVTRVEVALRRQDAAAAATRLNECQLRKTDPSPAHQAQALQRIELAFLRGEVVSLDAKLSDPLLQADAEARAHTALFAARMAHLQRDDSSYEAHLLDALQAARDARHPGLRARSASELGRLWLQQRLMDDVEPLLADAALWPEYAPSIALYGLYAESRGDLHRARNELLRAKELAGETWTTEFNQALRRVEASISASTMH